MQTPPCHEKVCVHYVCVPACETVASAEGHKTVSLHSSPSRYHPYLLPLPGPIVVPQVPETPMFQASAYGSRSH